MYVVINKKRIMLLCLPVLIIGLLVGGIIGIIPDEKTFGIGSGETLRVIVDAGHGLPDGGSVGANGSVESELNLAIADKLCEVLAGKGIEVIKTRESGNGIRTQKDGSWSKVGDMRARLQIMRKSDADLFISIHMNHFEQTGVHGLRLFYANNHEEIKELAEDMQVKMSEVTGAKVSTVKAADKNLFLMKSPPLPAVLVECGFISNPEEEKKLSTDEYQAKLAWAMAESIEAHFVNR